MRGRREGEGHRRGEIDMDGSRVRGWEIERGKETRREKRKKPYDESRRGP